MRIKNRLFSRFILLVPIVCAATQVFAAAHDRPSLSADAWITHDYGHQELVIHQPPPVPPIRIRAPELLRVDLNADTALLCGRGMRGMWRMDLQSGQFVRFDIAEDYDMPAPNNIVAARTRCATPDTDTSVLVLDKSGRVTTTRLVLPQGMSRFNWRDFSYDDVRDVYLATGESGYALIPADNVPGSVRVKEASGKVAEGSIAYTHFSGFSCCARLSGDGKTLFSVAHLGDEDMNGFTGLAAIDVVSGHYKRMYLPFSSVWQQTGRYVSRYTPPWFKLAGSVEEALWSQRKISS